MLPFEKTGHNLQSLRESQISGKKKVNDFFFFLR